MTFNRNDYVFTQHLKERFIQRSNRKYWHMQKCQRHMCDICDQMNKEIHTELIYEKQKVNKEILRRLNLAEENRSCLNNTEFMAWYYEKYGYNNRFEFLVHEDLLFVVTHDNGKKLVVTCVFSKFHLAGKNHNSKNRFNKVLKKKKKLENNYMNQFFLGEPSE